MTHAEILLTIFGMFVVSFIPRVLPPLFLSRHPIPKAFEIWLSYVPTSVFGALVFSEIFIRGDGFDFTSSNISLWASLVVTLVAAKTRSLAASIIVGLIAFGLLQRFV